MAPPAGAPDGAAAAKRPLNVSVGVLGHVDSGKTSLVAALSTKLSTAALDKHPQSKERGITLDLGFSSFTMPLPPHLAHLPHSELQFTLVDCPGHASLIRTIIGGVQIIDMAILVVDVTKGLQTQTAECLVVAEIAISRLVVVLNKIDLLPEEDRLKAVKRATKRLAQTLDLTKFAGVAILPVCARPGGGVGIAAPADVQASGGGGGGGGGGGAPGSERGGASAAFPSPASQGKGTAAAGGGGGEGGGGGNPQAAQGVDALKAHLLSLVPAEPRSVSGPLLFAVDHCFQIKGQGTVLTGTVLQGSVSVNDTIELPALRVTKQVKSIQMFRQPVPRAVRGDRAGVCVTQLDAGLMERGLAAAPGTVPTFSGAIAAVDKVRFFAGRVGSKSKFHVSVGHATVMAEIQVFGLPDGEGVSSDAAFKLLIDNLTALSLGGGAGNGGGGAAAAPSSKPSSSSSPPPPPPPPSLGFDFGREYLYQEELYGLEGRPLQSSAAAAADGSAASSTGLTATAASDGVHHSRQWAVLRFDQPVTAPADSVVIGARFDADAHGDGCRLAFYGRILSLLDPSKPQELQRLRVYKLKERTGVIDRVQPDGTTVICRGLLKKESDVSLFTGLKVLTGRGEAGVIEGSFGKSGKLKIAFPAPLAGVVSGGSSGGGQQPLQRSAEDNVIVLRCKRYVFDTDRKGLRQ